MTFGRPAEPRRRRLIEIMPIVGWKSLLAQADPPATRLVLDTRVQSDLDLTTLDMHSTLLRLLRSRDIEVGLADVRSGVVDAMRDHGLLEQLPETRIFWTSHMPSQPSLREVAQAPESSRSHPIGGIRPVSSHRTLGESLLGSATDGQESCTAAEVGGQMTEGMDVAVDDLGPVDYLVVEFPVGAANFTGEMAEELARLSAAGTIRILDLLVLHKNDDGSVEAIEIDDLEGVDAIRVFETQVAEILAAEDVEHLAAAMLPGSVAGVLVWENRWAAPFASAARRSGGQLIATGRIPIQAIAASIEAELAEQEEGN